MRLRHIYENISNGNNAFCVSVKQQDLVCGARLKNRLIFMFKLNEQELREKIAQEVADKMDYMGTCLNERNIILGIITGKREYIGSLCDKCWVTDCKSNE